MAINFKKLKSQIKPFKPEAKHTGYIFLATRQQEENGICSVAKPGSKRSLLSALVCFAKNDEDFKQEFTL